MVLIAQGMQEDEIFLGSSWLKSLHFEKATHLSLWSFFICFRKVCVFLQTLTGGWLKESSKHSSSALQPPRLEAYKLVLFLKARTLAPTNSRTCIASYSKICYPKMFS